MAPAAGVADTSPSDHHAFKELYYQKDSVVVTACKVVGSWNWSWRGADVLDSLGDKES